MQQNPEFILCDVADNHILMPTGAASIDLNGMVMLNDMGVVIWNALGEKCSAEEIVQRVLDEYEVSEEVARADIGKYLETLKNAGCVID